MSNAQERPSISTNVDPEIRDALVAEAEAEDRTLAAQVRRILTAYVTQKQAIGTMFRAVEAPGSHIPLGSEPHPPAVTPPLRYNQVNTEEGVA